MRWMRVGGGSTPVGVAPESSVTRGCGDVSSSLTNVGSLAGRGGGGGAGGGAGRGASGLGTRASGETGGGCEARAGRGEPIGGGCEGLFGRANAVGETGGDFESERLRRSPGMRASA